MGWSLCPKRRYTENKWIRRKNQNKLYFLHFIDVLILSEKIYQKMCLKNLKLNTDI